MRILKLEFENLNSLAGSWKIDFTHPDYEKNHDIFVIHGPTGAGKTTILDAITLGLYGRTPRLEAINNGEGGNELMTRGTGFCRSQVIYSCKKGIFVSEFQQNRAGTKPSGKLQKASFKITKILRNSQQDLFGNFSDSTLVASGTGSLLGAETQKIIQLDYNQFCRSIMLAQGEFSTFLKSQERERAEILEKLTGTERFREIGKRITTKFNEIKKSFNEKKAEKEEIEGLVFSNSELKEIQNQNSTLQNQFKNTEEQLLQVQKEISFYDELNRLEKEFYEAQQENKKIQQEVAEFLPLEKKFYSAQKAKNCEAEYIKLSSVQKNQNEDKEKINQIEKAIQKISVLFENALKAEESVKIELTEQEKNLLEQQKIWKKVRELDVSIVQIKKSFGEAEIQKNQAKKTKEESEQKINELKQFLEQKNAELSKINEYLLQNKIDSNLQEVITKLQMQSQNLTSITKKQELCQIQKNELLSKMQNLQNQLDLAKAELLKIEEEIQSFVSKDAIFISKLLQANLLEGSPCPVCGSVYHKNNLHKEKFTNSEENSTEEENISKSYTILKTSENLNTKQEEFFTVVQKLESSIESVKTELKNSESTEKSLQNEFEQILSSMNNLLLDWNITLDEKNTQDILDNLSKKFALWQKNDSLQKSYTAEQKEKNAELNARIQNQNNLNENFLHLEHKSQEIQQELDSILQERFAIFEQKSVDEEEKRQNQYLQELKNQFENAQKNQLAAKEEKSKQEAQKAQLEQNIKERETEIKTAEELFLQKIKENGFSSTKEFEESTLDEETFAQLSTQKENLYTQKTKAETSLKNAQDSYEKYKNSANLVSTKEELLKKQEEISKNRTEIQQKIIEIQTKLQANKQNQDKAAKILKEFTALQEEFSTWEQMKKWVGKDDGSDLSVFVQSLAFNKLLKLTNRTLHGITGRYSIVQKMPGSLDFEINDIYFEQPRSISNLSGGEQFLVSLSLALGISEFASRNVRVDSLFLDEGFGTLSGELLTGAINALKNLQKDGKMLGIITHVQEVINEIDQRIEVKQVNGGHSILVGSGISKL